MGFLGGSDGKESACNAGDLESISGLGTSSGEENGNPLQYSCLENSIDEETWWATVRGVAKSRTQLSNFHSLTHSPSTLFLSSPGVIKFSLFYYFYFLIFFRFSF